MTAHLHKQRLVTCRPYTNAVSAQLHETEGALDVSGILGMADGPWKFGSCGSSGPLPAGFFLRRFAAVLNLRGCISARHSYRGCQGRIVLVNGKTETTFGYQRAELIGQTIETSHRNPVALRTILARSR
jgi:PAS domain-containing protein